MGLYREEMWARWCYSILVYFIFQSQVNAEVVLLLGGEVDSLLHPAVGTINSWGPCGLFTSDLPELPTPRREFAAAMMGEDLVICGGYSFLNVQKDCAAINIGTWPLEWRTFPSMIHARDRHGLITLGDKLYAVGGSRSIGSERSIEMFDGTQWVEVGETNGFREDFCALAWGEDGILLTGGYDDVGSQRRTELFNVTSGTWQMLANMPGQGRGVHSCSHWMGGVVVAGGWTLAEDEISYDISNNVNWYDPVADSWTVMNNMERGRSSFALVPVNGTLTAIAGWNGMYTESIEEMGQDGVWHYLDQGLGEAKASFGIIKLKDGYFDDPNCVAV